MAQPTFAAPDLTTFTGLDQLGLTATGQHLTSSLATLECRIVDSRVWLRVIVCSRRSGAGHR